MRRSNGTEPTKVPAVAVCPISSATPLGLGRKVCSIVVGGWSGRLISKESTASSQAHTSGVSVRPPCRDDLKCWSRR